MIRTEEARQRMLAQKREKRKNRTEEEIAADRAKNCSCWHEMLEG